MISQSIIWAVNKSAEGVKLRLICPLFCNSSGIYLGMKSVEYFDGKTYEWIGLSRQTSFSGKVCVLTFKLPVERLKIVSPNTTFT